MESMVVAGAVPDWVAWGVGIGTLLSPIGVFVYLRLRYPAEWKK